MSAPPDALRAERGCGCALCLRAAELYPPLEILPLVDVQLESPNFTPQALRDFAARNYDRRNRHVPAVQEGERE